MQHNNIYTFPIVADLATKMEQHCPRSNKMRKDAMTYTDIARVWLETIPLYMLHDKTKTINNFGYFDASMMNYRAKLSSQYTLSGKRYRWFDWFVENEPLWKEHTKGNNMKHRPLTSIKEIYDLLTIAQHSDSKLYIDRFITDLETQGILVDGEIAPAYQDEYKIDLCAVNMESLNNYIDSTEWDLDHKGMPGNMRDTLTRNLVSALTIRHMCIGANIVDICKLTGKETWNFPVVIKKSQFGREYHMGTNLQNCGKAVRHAALGKCYEIDIESSVFTYYKNLAESSLGIEVPYAVNFMLENKKAFRNQLVNESFGNWNSTKNGKSIDLELKTTIIKSAITAIGFGAQVNDNKYSESIVNIIKNRDARTAFLAHQHVKDISKFINDIIDAMKTIYNTNADFKQSMQETLPSGCFDSRNSVKWRTVLAFLYQTEETKIMEDVIKAAEDQNLTLKLWVHDALYFDHKGFANAGMLETANWIANKSNNNIKFGLTQINDWARAARHQEEHNKEVASHEDRMKAEEQKARELVRA